MKRVSEGKDMENDTDFSPLWKNIIRFIGISKWTNNIVICEGRSQSEYITHNVLKK